MIVFLRVAPDLQQVAARFHPRSGFPGTRFEAYIYFRWSILCGPRAIVLLNFHVLLGFFLEQRGLAECPQHPSHLSTIGILRRCADGALGSPRGGVQAEGFAVRGILRRRQGGEVLQRHVRAGPGRADVDANREARRFPALRAQRLPAGSSRIHHGTDVEPLHEPPLNASREDQFLLLLIYRTGTRVSHALWFTTLLWT